MSKIISRPHTAALIRSHSTFHITPADFQGPITPAPHSALVWGHPRGQKPDPPGWTRRGTSEQPNLGPIHPTRGAAARSFGPKTIGPPRPVDGSLPVLACWQAACRPVYQTKSAPRRTDYARLMPNGNAFTIGRLIVSRETPRGSYATGCSGGSGYKPLASVFFRTQLQC